MSDLASLDARARLIFRQIVESYLETGAPVGSRVLSEVLEQQLSPASIRATMAQLERSGLLYAPHVSAGRLPTQSGLRLFIDGLLQVSELTAEERDYRARHAGRSGRRAIAETGSRQSFRPQPMRRPCAVARGRSDYQTY